MLTSLFQIHTLFFGLALFAVTINGCVVQDIGTTVEHSFKGDYYLSTQKYERGRQSFAQEVADNPDSSLAHYYYGRFLLEDEDYQQAFKHLSRARDLDSQNADYHFWAGLAAGGLGDVKSEEASYRKALQIDGKHLQSLIYLGHLDLEKKRYKEALDLYSRALEIGPNSPSALYNRALVPEKAAGKPP